MIRSNNYFMDKKLETDILIIRINSKIVSKSNFRKGKDSWKRFKEFEKLITASVINKIRKENYLIDRNYFCGVVLLANSRIDVGNYSKSVLDALEGIIYENDNQVKICIAIQDDLLDKECFYIGIKFIEKNEYKNISKKNEINSLLEKIYQDIFIL